MFHRFLLSRRPPENSNKNLNCLPLQNFIVCKQNKKELRSAKGKRRKVSNSKWMKRRQTQKKFHLCTCGQFKSVLWIKNCLCVSFFRLLCDLSISVSVTQWIFSFLVDISIEFREIFWSRSKDNFPFSWKQ